MTLRLGSKWILPALSAAVLLTGAGLIKWHRLRAPTGSKSTLKDRTILVLPFRSANGSDRVTLGASLASEVEAALTASHQLTVRSWDLGRLSTSPLPTPAPADEAAALAVGRKQRAGYILLGQVERLAIRTEIAVRLMRVGDGHPVWSGIYWRDPDGMTAFPSELAQDVAEALRLPSSAGRSTPKGPAQKSAP